MRWVLAAGLAVMVLWTGHGGYARAVAGTGLFTGGVVTRMAGTS